VGRPASSRLSREKVAAGAIVTVGALLFVGWAFRMYAVPDPWRPYAIAVRQYMAAGLRGDSNALTRRSASAQPVTWVLEAVHQQPRMVATWAHDLVAGGGQRRGDTVLVALRANNVEGCPHVNSVSALLLNHSATPRVLAVSSPCIRPPAPEPDR
jgi:hypothetical protein